MDIREFVKTIYLGDRACKKIVIDAWNRRFGIQIDCISRLAKGTQSWNYYNDENIVDGWLVFEGLTSVSITPPGVIPDDLINGIEVSDADDRKVSVIDIFVAASIGGGETVEATIQIIATEMYVQTNEEFLAGAS